MTRGRLFVEGLLLATLVFCAVASFAIWEDGVRFAPVSAPRWKPPDGMADASHLEPGRVDWKTAETLREYAREHREQLVDRIEEIPTP